MVATFRRHTTSREDSESFRGKCGDPILLVYEQFCSESDCSPQINSILN